VVGSISGDGHHVVFQSGATNLVASDTNGIDDVFVRDIVSGMTTRESVSTGGAQADGEPLLLVLTSPQAISTDGNLVTFASRSTNLVAGDTDGVENIFIRNRSVGTTTRVNGPGSTQMRAFPMAVSGDGSTILFFSTTPGVAPRWDGDSVNDPTQDAFIGVLYAYHTGSSTLVPLRGYGFFENVQSLTSDGSEAVVTTFLSDILPGHSQEFAYLVTVP
jgi:hypothetical protein